MRYELTDDEWTLIRPMLSDTAGRADGRRVLNGIFRILRSGAPWRDLPDDFGLYTTCYNRFVRWRRAGVIDSDGLLVRLGLTGRRSSRGWPENPSKVLAPKQSDIAGESCNAGQRSILFKHSSLRLDPDGSVGAYPASRRRSI